MKIGISIRLFLFICPIIVSCSPASRMQTSSNKPNDNLLLVSLLKKYSTHLDSVLSNTEKYRTQIIYSRIERKGKKKVLFMDHTFNVDTDNYFYPASTVKLPVAILALQKINELNISNLTANTTMITGEDDNGQTRVLNDPSAKDGRPTIAHYIKKILLVSDNDAFNRLYEFLGQEYINTNLYKLGFMESRIIHRLDISLTEQQNRHTNPVWFTDSTGKKIFAQNAQKSQIVFDKTPVKMGIGFMKNGVRINEPFDFSLKNRLSLPSLHGIVKRILFPEAFSENEKFVLKDEDYAFLRKYMSLYPRESDSPVYDQNEYWDTYTKFILYGAEKVNPSPGIRIYNKTGTAYGFLLDAAYVKDEENDIEFLVSAVIYCNSDGIFNDDTYDYTNVGYPFFRDLGKALLEYEKSLKIRN